MAENNLPARLEDVVMSRVTPIIAELLPEADLRNLVSAAVTNFTRATLPKLLEAELRERFTNILKDELGKPAYRDVWENGAMRAGPAVQEIVAKLVPELVTSMYSGIAALAVQKMRDSLQRGY